MSTFDNPTSFGNGRNEQNELMRTTREIFLNSITGSVSGGVKDALDFVAKSSNPGAAALALEKALTDYKVFPPSADIEVNTQGLIDEIYFPDGESNAKIEYSNQNREAPSHIHFHGKNGELDIKADGKQLSLISSQTASGEQTKNTVAGTLKIDQSTGFIEMDVLGPEGKSHSAVYHPDGGFEYDGHEVLPNMLELARDKIQNTPDPQVDQSTAGQSVFVGADSLYKK
ncbi:MAG: hypothetical protein JST89_24205 [Cyanobacteria bacterium SZAS-4]|nr:hypothetical protein [Cyanobacteria bacterium SZAS-4]